MGGRPGGLRRRAVGGLCAGGPAPSGMTLGRFSADLTDSQVLPVTRVSGVQITSRWTVIGVDAFPKS